MKSSNKCQEYAAVIMSHLEDMRLVVMNIQRHDHSLRDIVNGVEAIRAQLKTVDNILSEAEALITAFGPD